MAVNSTHPDYDASAADWSRARDVLAGEDAVKSAGEKYLPRLDSQTDEEFLSYRKRAAFFNATARSAEGFIGLIFRRPPFIKIPEATSPRPSPPGAERLMSGVGRALAGFVNDADMLGTTLAGYAKGVVSEVVGLGRAGSLVDWEGEIEKRAYVSLYSAEQILNWRVERVNGRNVPTLVVLSESVVAQDGDGFELQLLPQIRVLKLVPEAGTSRTDGTNGTKAWQCVVEIWRPKDLAVGHRPAGQRERGAKVEWELVEGRTPLRLGKPLPLIPFVFHGPRHSRSEVDRPPLRDIIAVNLDHYRLNADYKHGVHFTALPTAWVSGFPKDSELKIGPRTAWVIDSQVRFNGGRTKVDQALQWPRVQCPDPGRGFGDAAVLGLVRDNFFPSDEVPKAVVDATCEMARELLIVDRTAAPAGEGVSSTWTDTSGTKYDKSDTRPIISHVAQAMLARFGALVRARAGQVALVRT